MPSGSAFERSVTHGLDLMFEAGAYGSARAVGQQKIVRHRDGHCFEQEMTLIEGSAR